MEGAELLANLGQLHTTKLGLERIKRNLSLNTDQVIAWCREKISSSDAVIVRNGKNWYVKIDGCTITVNAHSYTIITAHKDKGKHFTKEMDERIEPHMGLIGLSCIFPVPNIKKTTEFYVSGLGFRAVEYLECKEPHVCLYRDDIEILLLQANADRVLPNRELYGYGYDAYFYTNDQEQLEKELIAKGIKFVRTLEVTDYQNKEFVIEDLDGRWLAFGLKQKGK